MPRQFYIYNSTHGTISTPMESRERAKEAAEFFARMHPGQIIEILECVGAAAPSVFWFDEEKPKPLRKKG